MPDVFDQIHADSGTAPAAGGDIFDQIHQDQSGGKTWSDKAGIQNRYGRAVTDAAEGAASGLASTVFNGGELIRSGLRKIGVPMDRVIDRPEVQQAMHAPDSTAGQIGRFGEQAAEFMGGGEAADALSAGSKLIPRVLAHGAASGAVGALQSGGNAQDTGVAAATGAAGPLLGAAARGGAKLLDRSGLSEKLYQSALKPTWSMEKKAGGQLVKTGLDEGIPVSSAGLAKVDSKIGDLQKQISTGIKDRAAAGLGIDTTKVVDGLSDLEDFYKKTATPISALQTISDLKDEFQAYHGQTIPVDLAQQIKINTYQALRKSYGEMKGAQIEGVKQIARGIKDQISNVFPEIKGLNENQSHLLELNDALHRAVWRIENHQIMGLGAPMAATAGHAVLGGPGAVAGLVGKLVLEDPSVKSRLAIALRAAGHNAPFTAATGGLRAVKGSLQALANRHESSQGAEGGEPLDVQSQPELPNIGEVQQNGTDRSVGQ